MVLMESDSSYFNTIISTLYLKAKLCGIEKKYFRLPKAIITFININSSYINKFNYSLSDINNLLNKFTKSIKQFENLFKSLKVPFEIFSYSCYNCKIN